MRQAPRYQSVLLLVGRVALVLPISAAADTPLGACAGLAVLYVIVTVDQLAALCSVFQCHHLKHLVSYPQFGYRFYSYLVREISPV